MNFANAPFDAARIGAGVDARALRIAAVQAMRVVVVPPRSPGPGRP